jgi:hypothetical protein
MHNYCSDILPETLYSVDFQGKQNDIVEKYQKGVKKHQSQQPTPNPSRLLEPT